jgi:hypothetical protein
MKPTSTIVWIAKDSRQVAKISAVINAAQWRHTDVGTDAIRNKLGYNETRRRLDLFQPPFFFIAREPSNKIAMENDVQKAAPLRA